MFDFVLLFNFLYFTILLKYILLLNKCCVNENLKIQYYVLTEFFGLIVIIYFLLQIVVYLVAIKKKKIKQYYCYSIFLNIFISFIFLSMLFFIK